MYLLAPLIFPISHVSIKLMQNTIMAINSIEKTGLKLVDFKLNISSSCITKSCII